MIRYGLALTILLLAHPGHAQTRGFSKTPCPEGLAGEGQTLTCGKLRVVEDRAAPGGKTLDLMVVVVRSPAKNRHPDPVVFLAGGPGQSAVDTARSWSTHPLLRQRDIVLLDLRGLGRSQPLCPKLSKKLFEVMARDLTVKEDIAAQVAATRACRQAMLRRGVKPGTHGSIDSAADLEQLRRALGYERWNLFGVSYGARLALTAMRTHPAGIRSVILDSPLALEDDFYHSIPMDYRRGILKLSADCHRDPRCRGAAGTLKDEYDALVAALKKAPLVVPMDDMEKYPSGTFVLNQQDFQFFFSQFLHSTTMRPILPALLRATRQGHARVWATLIRIFAEAYGAINIGMYYAVQCREELPFARPATDAGRAIGIIGAAHAVCSDWGVEPAPAVENQPVKSDIPALILSGALDTRTPPARLGPLQKNLSRSHLVSFPNSGHSVYSAPCARQVVASFLDRPGRAPQESCLSGLKPAPLIGRVTLRGGMLKVLRMFTRQQYGQLGAAAASLLVLLLILLVWPVLVLVRKIRRRQPPSDRARRLVPWSIWLTGLLALGFCALLGATLATTFNTQPALILLGLPASAGKLFVLPKLMAGVSLAGVVGLLLAWRKAGWSRLVKVAYVLSFGACFYLVLFLLRADLF